MTNMNNKNVIDCFVADKIIIDPSYTQDRCILYKQFIIYCEENKVKNIIQKNRFNAAMKLKFGPAYKNNTMYYRGFKVKEIHSSSLNNAISDVFNVSSSESESVIVDSSDSH